MEVKSIIQSMWRFVLVLTICQQVAGQKSEVKKYSKVDPCAHLITDKRKLLEVFDGNGESVYCCACGRNMYMDKVCRSGYFDTTDCRTCPPGTEIDDTAHVKGLADCTPIKNLEPLDILNVPTVRSTTKAAYSPAVDFDSNVDNEAKRHSIPVSPHTAEPLTSSTKQSTVGRDENHNNGKIVGILIGCLSLIALGIILYVGRKLYRHRRRNKRKKILASPIESTDQSAETINSTGGNGGGRSRPQGSRDDEAKVTWVSETKVPKTSKKAELSDTDEQSQPLIESSQTTGGPITNKVDAIGDNHPSALIHEPDPPPRRAVTNSNDREEHDGVFPERREAIPNAPPRNIVPVPNDTERQRKFTSLEALLTHVTGIVITPFNVKQLASFFLLDINKQTELERKCGKGDVRWYLVEVIRSIRETSTDFTVERLLDYWKKHKPELWRYLMAQGVDSPH